MGEGQAGALGGHLRHLGARRRGPAESCGLRGGLIYLPPHESGRTTAGAFFLCMGL